MKKLLFVSLMYISIALMSCSGTYVISDRPVTPYYARPVSPGVGYIWIDGDWRWESNHYAWHEGRWDRPRGNHHWEGGSWERHGRGYIWRSGRWSR